MPQILCLANYFVNHGGGVEQMAHGLAARLNRIPGWHVTLAAHAETALPVPSGLPYQVVPLRCSNGMESRSGLPLIFPNLVDLFRLLRHSRSADAILLHDNVYLSHLALLVVALCHRQKLIVVKHTGRVRLESRLADLIQSVVNTVVLTPLLRRSDGVVFVTEEKHQNYGATGAETQIIPNGIDTDHFRPEECQKVNADILFVGRFVRKKGIEILREMARQAPDLTFHCAGFGPIDPREWRLPNVKVEERPGLGRLPALYREARLHVVPAETEGTPLTVLEALACGTPVLASTTARPRDAETANVIHLADVDLGRPSEIANEWLEAARRLLSAERDPATLRAPVMSGYSIDSTAARYRVLIERIIEAS